MAPQLGGTMGLFADEGDRVAALEAENTLLQERVNELAAEVDEVVAEIAIATVLLERVPEVVNRLKDERVFLLQTLVAIQAYEGENVLVPTLMAEAALSDVMDFEVQ